MNSETTDKKRENGGHRIVTWGIFCIDPIPPPPPPPRYKCEEIDDGS